MLRYGVCMKSVLEDNEDELAYGSIRRHQSHDPEVLGVKGRDRGGIYRVQTEEKAKAAYHDTN